MAAVRWNVLAILGVLSVGSLGCGAHGTTAQPKQIAAQVPAVQTVDAWDEFWRARSVSPPPPKDFLEYEGPLPEMLNLTHGLLTDETVRKWIVADLRRGKGDGWAGNHLRRDLVNADVLGPPGLNGSERGIASEMNAGAVELRCKSSFPVVAAGVISVSKETQRRIAWARLSDFVIVQVTQSTGESCSRVMLDGTVEKLPVRGQRGELHWQLDTGELREDPVVGPLWYQANGWSCKMDGTGMLDEICGLVRPSSKAAVGSAPR